MFKFIKSLIPLPPSLEDLGVSSTDLNDFADYYATIMCIGISLLRKPNGIDEKSNECLEIKKSLTEWLDKFIINPYSPYNKILSPNDLVNFAKSTSNISEIHSAIYELTIKTAKRHPLSASLYIKLHISNRKENTSS